MFELKNSVVDLRQKNTFLMRFKNYSSRKLTKNRSFLLRAWIAESCHNLHLNLRGNLCHWDSLQVLHDWLIGSDCPLQTLDLSWQQLPASSSSYTTTATYKSKFMSQKCPEPAVTATTATKNKNNKAFFSNVSVLFKALCKNKFLQKLKLSETKLKIETWKCLPSVSQKMQPYEYWNSDIVKWRITVHKSLPFNLSRSIWKSYIWMDDKAWIILQDWKSIFQTIVKQFISPTTRLSNIGGGGWISIWNSGLDFTIEPIETQY